VPVPDPAASTPSRRGWRRWAPALVAILLALYGAFELGRWAAGYSVVDAVVERVRLEWRVAELGRAGDRLRRELAAAQTAREMDREAQREAQRMLGEMQAEAGRQQQELQFYRGVLAREFGTGVLRVRDLVVRPAGRTSYVIEATLVQAGGRDAQARGELALWIDGTRAGAIARLDLSQVTADARRSLPFSLRYFQALQVPVTLPEGFEPASVTVELRSPAAGSAPERRTFTWRAEASDALTPSRKGE